MDRYQAWLLLAKILLCAALIYSFNISYIEAHEQAHHQIFEYSGMNSTITIDYLHLSGYTEGIGHCSRDCELSNDLNEIVGYPIQIMLNVLLVGVAILIMKV